MASTNVLYVKPQYAKRVKTKLENLKYLDKRFRMTPKLIPITTTTTTTQVDKKTPSYEKLIVIPIVEECFHKLSSVLSISSNEENSFQVDKQDDDDDDDNDGNEIKQSNNEKLLAIKMKVKVKEEKKEKDEKKDEDDWIGYVHSMGIEICPYSTFMLGNHNSTKNILTSSKKYNNDDDDNNNYRYLAVIDDMNTIQKALFYTVQTKPTRTISSSNRQLANDIRNLPLKSCPKKLEQLGDDCTLVIPSQAFLPTEFHFQTFLKTHVDHNKEEVYNRFLILLWETMAQWHSSQNHDCLRVVRRGEICPNSKIRESGHSILWISPNHKNTTTTTTTTTTTITTAATTAADQLRSSPGWITVTEQGIKQSFDLTKVMFSRGNITEKIRFGKLLVQRDEVVLDMYAGIGYYTLPALLSSSTSSSTLSSSSFNDNNNYASSSSSLHHLNDRNKMKNTTTSRSKSILKKQSKLRKGTTTNNRKAKFVYACEWNPNAYQYLKYNLKQNGVPDHQYQLFHGDCRTILKEMRDTKTFIFQKESQEPRQHENDNGILDTHDSKTMERQSYDGNNEYNNRIGPGVDRISLGLLPSSEGGWEMAVQCLRKDKGGWLHVHGNVAVSERWDWSIWVCVCLLKLVDQQQEQEQEQEQQRSMQKTNHESNWYVICNHVERVKSFAPKVDHLVADIFVGPMIYFRKDPNCKMMKSTTKDEEEYVIIGRAFVIDESGTMHSCPKHVIPPSCALSQTGKLNQEWMR